MRGCHQPLIRSRIDLQTKTITEAFLMENLTHIISNTVHGQLLFGFAWENLTERYPREGFLLELLANLDYSRFDAGLCRHAKVPPERMMAFIVYGRIHGAFSCRDLEWLAQRDMFVRDLLGGDAEVSYSTIDRFVSRNGKAIDDAFCQLVRLLVEKGEIDPKTIFQDGTKLESRASKYSFVWKGAVEKNIERYVNRFMSYADDAKSLSLIPAEEQVSRDDCVERMKRIADGIVGTPLLETGRGHRKDPLMTLKALVESDYGKLKAYEDYIVVMGDGRNSLSKTDEDATFMRMKEDAMRNGQLKPAYNIQNLTASGYVVCSGISQDRTDYATCEPTVEKFCRDIGVVPDNYVADSGYDNVTNFNYLKGKGIKPYIKPQTWEMSKKRSFRNDIGRYQNMDYDKQDDVFICKNGKRLRKTKERRRRDSGALYGTYECESGCQRCPFRDECLGPKRKGEKRARKHFDACVEHWELRQEAYGLLSSDEGILMRLNRSIQAEGAFAQIKGNSGFRRFFSFGMKRVFTEWIIQCIALDIETYTNRMSRDRRTDDPFWFVPESSAVV